MLKRFILLIVLLPSAATGQVEDDFSDGEINQNPGWTGDTQLFTVNNYKQLQLNDAAAGNASLFTAIDTRDTMEWQFWIRQAFSPSANNYSRVYLMAENADTSGKPDGVFLQFGEGGSNDAVRLMIGGGVPKLIERGFRAANAPLGDDEIQASTIFHIIVCFDVGFNGIVRISKTCRQPTR